MATMAGRKSEMLNIKHSKVHTTLTAPGPDSAVVVSHKICSWSKNRQKSGTRAAFQLVPYYSYP